MAKHLSEETCGSNIASETDGFHHLLRRSALLLQMNGQRSCGKGKGVGQMADRPSADTV